MVQLIKWLFILSIFCIIGLSAYAYIGPFLGVDFSPSQSLERIPVELNES